MPDQPDSTASPVDSVVSYLRNAHLARGGAYLGLAALTMQAFSLIVPRSAHHDLERVHLIVLPLTLGVTRAFAELRPEDRAHWQQVAVRDGLHKFAQGAGLGAGALLIALGLARSRGWLSAPKWGFQDTHPAQVAGSMAVSAVGHLAIAWNEELVFRGYAHTTLALALPGPLADGLLVALFALFHPLRPRTLAGEAAFGLALVGLRDQYGDIWMPVGYHWAWNVLQTAVFGPSDGASSLRPLVIHGPPEWVGRPGHPEPGYLSTLVSLSVAIGAFLCSRRYTGRR